MSRLSDQSRQSATVIAAIVLIVALMSAVAWKAARDLNPSPPVPGAVHAATAAAPSARLAADYGKLPISFEVNQGQTDKPVQFLARGAGYTLFLTPGEAVLALHAPPADAGKPGDSVLRGALRPVSNRVPWATPASPPASIVWLQLIGANTAAEAAGVDRLPGNSNYLIGNDPAKWHTDVPTYAKVRYSNVYPGIDLVYYGNQEGRLEHDFVVAPGADPKAIAIGLRGSDGAAPDENGGVILHTKTGDLTLRSPVAYQTIGDQRKTVSASYLLANNQIRFQLGNYDRKAPLIIDPVVQYTAIFGGSDADAALAIAVDSSGNSYVTGWTLSTDFPLVHSLQGTWSGDRDPFVVKINAAGTALVYSAYIGGPGGGNGIAVDNSGRAYVVGTTLGGLPVKNAYQPTLGGWVDAFLTVLSPAGNDLVYSTYLGGDHGDAGVAVAVDASGSAYIAGRTYGGYTTYFPTLHSVQPKGRIFSAKFNSAGVLQYCSVFSPLGTEPDRGIFNQPQSIAVDASGSAYITGVALESNLPVSKNAFQKTPGDGFVTKLSPSGDSLAYSTYFPNMLVGIAVDSSGNAYVAGSTGPGFPITKNAFRKTYGGNGDGFVAKLNASGSDLICATYLGGSGGDTITGLVLDQYRQVYLTGYTNSPDFPLKAPVQNYPGSFVTTLSSSLGSIVYYSSYFGTLNPDWTPDVIAVDKALNVYVAGNTTIAGIEPTPGALHPGTPGNPGGAGDIFVSKLVIMDDLILGISASPSFSVTYGSNLTYTLAATSKGPDFGYNMRIDDPLPAGTTFVSYAASRGTCTAPAVGATGTLHCQLQQLEKGDTFVVMLTVKVNAQPGSTLTNTATAVSNMQDFVPSNNKATYTSKVKLIEKWPYTSAVD